jgi:aspartyl-tRNA(Asn)/glutamyl-tRNA(Gln) amidotransferase subunit A
VTIAGAVRTRATSARNVVAAALARIAVRDARLNAFTTVFTERAMARATAIDAELARGRDPGPLAGVPFAAQNLFDVAGVVTRAGAKVTWSDPPASGDADAVAALERAGAVLVGVTNMDEFADGFVTENAHDGPTHNPHDLTRIAGGSSGGSAAAVAAELVPIALASDTNGSIRVPAALCGIFGIRPTYGTVSTRGAYPFAGSFDTVGPFARTACDLRAAFTALAPDHEPYTGPRTRWRCARLGGFFEEGLLPAARVAVDMVSAALRAVDGVELAGARQARAAAFVITAAEAGRLHAARLRERADDYDPATRDRLIAGALMPPDWHACAQRFGAFFRSHIAEAFASYDVLIAAATPHAATAIGQRSIVVDGEEREIRPNVGVFTQPITLAGVPVVTVPVVRRGSLPVGVQLIGPPGSEGRLLAVAAELERLGVAGAGTVPAVA